MHPTSRIVLAGVLAAWVLGAAATTLRAQVDDSLRRQLSDIRQQLSDRNREISDYSKQISDLQKQVPPLKDAVDKAKAEVAVARQPIDEANKTIGDSQRLINELAAKITKDFEASAEWQAVVKEVALAGDALETAKQAAMPLLEAKPEYQAAAERLVDAKRRLDLLKSSGAAQERITEAAAYVVECEAALTKLVNDVLADNPEYQAAKARLDKARAAQGALRGQLEQMIMSNPERLAAVKAMEGARAKLLASQAKMTEAVRKWSQADAALNRVLEQGRRLESARSAAQAEKDRLERLRDQKERQLRNYTGRRYNN